MKVIVHDCGLVQLHKPDAMSYDIRISGTLTTDWKRVFEELVGDMKELRSACRNGALASKPNARPHAPERSDGSVQADVGNSGGGQ